MEQEITYAKWEEFLNGSLENEEYIALEQALQNDTSLQAQLALYREVRNAQNDPELDAFNLVANQVREQYTQSIEEKNIKTIKTPWLPIAAIAALFIGLIFWFLFRPSSLSTKELYSEYAIHDISIQQMSTTGELGTIQSLLMSEQYENVLPIINNYLAANPDAADVQLTKGIALLETNQIAEALQTFTTLEENHPIYANEAKWYQALTFLKNEQTAEAQAILGLISPQSSRYKEAQVVLKKIGK